jgi:hypothetical protein
LDHSKLSCRERKYPVASTLGKRKVLACDTGQFRLLVIRSCGNRTGISQARKSTPEFGEDAYVKYYWHSFADQAVGNYLTEAIVPTVTRQDPRYYTLGHGGFFRRTGYALSRLLINRTDSGGRSFNFSEIVGNGAGAGISNLYYPQQERTWTKTGQSRYSRSDSMASSIWARSFGPISIESFSVGTTNHILPLIALAL